MSEKVLEPTTSIRVQREYLVLLDGEWSEPSVNPILQPPLRRPLLGLYDIAVILLLAVSFAAAVVCLMRMG